MLAGYSCCYHVSHTNLLRDCLSSTHQTWAIGAFRPSILSYLCFGILQCQCSHSHMIEYTDLSFLLQLKDVVLDVSLLVRLYH